MPPQTPPPGSGSLRLADESTEATGLRACAGSRRKGCSFSLSCCFLRSGLQSDEGLWLKGTSPSPLLRLDDDEVPIDGALELFTGSL
mmetsp:Transcript_41953/g.75909  ORF Transcript_41953/g.75909 Transcript_41953/m.75909 type:complete len:87 (-) Transcript_41953:82-342(-)